MAGQFDQIGGGSDPRQQTEYFTADIADVISVAEASYTAASGARLCTGRRLRHWLLRIYRLECRQAHH